MMFTIADLLADVTFKASRSGGKGGQHVNKVASKVELGFNLANSTIFSEDEKRRIRSRLANRITSDDAIKVTCEEERSQFLNKQRCLDKLVVLIRNALHVQKPRKATKPKKSAIEARLKSKRQQALKKIERRRNVD